MRRTTMQFLMVLIVGIPMIMQFSCTDDKSVGGHSGQLRLTSFYPDSGYLSSKIIIEGENLGSDTSQLAVYFNKKRAFISQSAGNILMVYAPRLPGDTCVISVIKGKDSIAFDKTFRYISRFTVDNVCGKDGSKTFIGTDLASTTIANWEPKVSCCDDEGNYYVCLSNYNSKTGGLVLISEKNNVSKSVLKVAVNDVIYQKETGKLYAVSTFNGIVYEIDPSNDWKSKNRYLRPQSPPAKQVNVSTMGCIAYCSVNNYFYVRNGQGELFRFKMDNLDCEYVGVSKYHNSVGSAENRQIVSMKFDPTNPTILYTSYGDKAVISSFDVVAPGAEEQLYAGIPGNRAPGDANAVVNGHRLDSRFNWNNQLTIVNDETGRKIMYIADAGTQTIRQIDMNTGMVTTSVGRQGVRGNQSGTPLEATFAWPKGIGLTKEGDLYISDSGSGCIRKLSLR